MRLQEGFLMRYGKQQYSEIRRMTRTRRLELIWSLNKLGEMASGKTIAHPENEEE